MLCLVLPDSPTFARFEPLHCVLLLPPLSAMYCVGFPCGNDSRRIKMLVDIFYVF